MTVAIIRSPRAEAALAENRRETIMSESPAVVGVRNPYRHAIAATGRAIGVAAGAATLIVAGILHTQPIPARGAALEPTRSEKSVQATPPASALEFVAGIRRMLTKEQDRMIKLAEQVLHFNDASKQAEDQISSQKILVEAARARSENAKIARQVAEMKVAEFVDGQSKQDLALAESEIKVAQEQINLLPERTKQARQRLGEIKLASRGSPVDLSIEYDAEIKVESAAFAERRAKLVLEQAESKKKFLVEYTKPKTITDLRSAVAKARADELATTAALDLENAKVKRLERDAKEKGLPPDMKHVLVLLDQAISIQERIRGMIDQVTRDGNFTEARQKEMQDTMSQLGAIVDEADGTRAGLQFDRLKPRIHRAVSRLGTPRK
jgi:hypothetical protein